MLDIVFRRQRDYTNPVLLNNNDNKKNHSSSYCNIIFVNYTKHNCIRFKTMWYAFISKKKKNVLQTADGLHRIKLHVSVFGKTYYTGYTVLACNVCGKVQDDVRRVCGSFNILICTLNGECRFYSGPESTIKIWLKFPEILHLDPSSNTITLCSCTLRDALDGEKIAIK